ncbi:MAG TPA: PLP-dependent aminotransferase family protein [Bryobacteraceae bacterium]|nr:PLP-dependent aminotransferase family protein [Bryobacteraceae bacterium]
MRTQLHGALSPLIALDRKRSKPLHRQIYDSFRGMILKRALQPGQQVPSTRTLAEELGISRIPVLGAYDQLLAEGYLESRAGAGTFVSSLLPEEALRGRPGGGSGKAKPGSVVISRLSRSLPLEWTRGSGSFSVGQIAYDHFPLRIWSGLVRRRLRTMRTSAMNYSDPMGSKKFREVIAAYLRTSRAVDCEVPQIMIVNGSQQALDLCARVLLDPGSPVWIEDPGYDLMRQALMLSGCRQVPVPVDDEGLNVAAGMKRCRKARAAFVTPSHQYPLGATMSVSRRLQLLDWAHRQSAWIVEDDYDSEYRFESMPIASLQGLDHGSRVIYIGTFSKVLFPSLRLGYMVIPSPLVDRFSAVRRASDFCPSNFHQAVLADFIEEGHFARHIRKTKQLYAERRGALVQAIKKVFGDELEILGAEAGMHLVVTLPQGFSDREISVRAAQQNLSLWPLSPCYAGPRARQGFILGFGSTKASDMAAQVARLRQLIYA